MVHLSCFDVAEYFLSKTDDEAGDVMSNLQLQKLVYYAQGFSLALKGEPLFREPLTAWQHGPVCVPLFERYERNGTSGIPAPEIVEFDKFSQDERDLLDEVYAVYGQFAAWKLRNMSCNEAPLKSTPVGCVIPNAVMMRCFRERLRNF